MLSSITIRSWACAYWFIQNIPKSAGFIVAASRSPRWLKFSNLYTIQYQSVVVMHWYFLKYFFFSRYLHSNESEKKKTNKNIGKKILKLAKIVKLNDRDPIWLDIVRMRIVINNWLALFISAVWISFSFCLCVCMCYWTFLKLVSPIANRNVSKNHLTGGFVSLIREFRSFSTIDRKKTETKETTKSKLQLPRKIDTIQW